jgi:serine/threonine-protein kinase
MLGVHNLRPPEEVMPRARSAALAALALDDGLPEAHASLALVRAVFDWARQDALDEYERMVHLDPAYAPGLQSYAVHGLAPLRRFDEAIDLLQRALAIDPVSLPVNGTFGFVLSLAGRLGEAIDVLQRALELAPHPITHFFLGNALAELGDTRRGVEHLQTAVALSGGRPDIMAALGCALAGTGEREGARVVLAQLTKLSSRRYVSPVGHARIYAMLGDADGAIRALDHAVQLRATDLTWIHVEAPFLRLAGRPAFTALLQRLQLAPGDPA